MADEVSPEKRDGPDSTNQTDQDTQQLMFPPVTGASSSILPPSLMQLQENKKRTIETEFGTIIIDHKGITIDSEGHLPTTVQSGSGATDGASSTSGAPVKVSSHAFGDAEGLRNSKESHVGSRMFLMNTPKTSSMVMETVAERQTRLERGVWRSDFEHLTVTCSALCGISNVMSFPILWLEYGGAAFLIAYAVMLVVLAMPLFALETSLGQYTAHGIAALMPQMGPALRGYSYAPLLSLAIITVSYVPDISSAAIYGIDAMRQPQPWTACSSYFNSELCYTHTLDRHCQRVGARLYAEGRCVSDADICAPLSVINRSSAALMMLRAGCTVDRQHAIHLNVTRVQQLRVSAGNEYFNNAPHRVTESAGRVHVRSVSALLVCWGCVALLSLRGLDGVRLTLPLVLGLPLLVTGALLVNMMISYGALHKVWRLLIPDVGKLDNSGCWLHAAIFSLQSLSIGTGVNTLIYSRNLLTHDCRRSTLKVVLLMLVVTSLFGVTYTLLLGQHAVDQDVDVGELIKLHAFQHPVILLADSLGSLNYSQVWSALFFLAAILLGLGSCQVFILTIEDGLREIHVFNMMGTRAALFTLCIIFMLFDLLFMFPSGYHIIIAINFYATTHYGIVITLMLVVAVNAILGVDRLLSDIVNTMAVHIKWWRRYWGVSWRYTCPTLLLVLFTWSIVHQAGRQLTHHGERLPGWTSVFGGIMVLLPMLLLVGVLFRVYHDKESFGVDLFSPTDRWRPGLMTKSMSTVVNPLISDGNTSSHALSSVPSLMTRMYGKLSTSQMVIAPQSKTEKDSSEQQLPDVQEAVEEISPNPDSDQNNPAAH